MISKWSTPGLVAATVIAAMSAMAAVAPSANAMSYTLTTLHNFCSAKNCADGANPGGLLLDQSGNLYGVTVEAGPHHGRGVIFELVGGRKFKVLYGFCAHKDCSDGEQPFAPLIEDTAGNLYGTTSSGGAHAAGVAFQLSPNADRSAWTLHKLYDFCTQPKCADGGFPAGGLSYAGAETGALYDGSSPLYGLTAGGGSGNGGAAFVLVPGLAEWSETVIYDFCSQGGAACIDGTWPSGSLLVNSGGILFGVTQQGGKNHLEGDDPGAGVAFQLAQNNGIWSETVLYDFCGLSNCKDGGHPFASLIEDSAGNLYGTTAHGGRACNNPALNSVTCGVIFKLIPNGTASQEIVLHRFCRRDDCADGAIPEASLIRDSFGNLFGTAGDGGGHDAEPGGTGGGVAFELSGSDFHVLHAFCAQGGNSCTDGWSPLANLVMDGSGDLFGTTYLGPGSVFKLTP